jgi:hypothetical protein
LPAQHGYQILAFAGHSRQDRPHMALVGRREQLGGILVNYRLLACVEFGGGGALGPHMRGQDAENMFGEHRLVHRRVEGIEIVALEIVEYAQQRGQVGVGHAPERLVGDRLNRLKRRPARLCIGEEAHQVAGVLPFESRQTLSHLFGRTHAPRCQRHH